ncbi:MAG TPA: cytochrome c [Bradyrhizobium sp.]|nr:cytochrome c [Bradyrhizobium sp.]
MLRKLILLAIVAGVIGLALFWFLTIPGTVPASALAAHTPNLANGKEMFYAGGCASCHATPEQTDKTKLGGGLGLHSPFGTFYVPNVSPDPKDGIGSWNEQQFVTAMSKGTSPDGKHYFPAFPYPSYTLMPVNDVRDLFAYLKTLPAVQGKIRDHDVQFPFNIRRNVGGWKLMFFKDETFKPDASKSAEWNRGAYLVNGPGHCAECHSPRNFMGGIKAGQRFAGGPNPEGKGWVPNITQKGLKDWSKADIEYMLESGQLPDGDSVGQQMTAVVRNTAELSATDRSAIATYLKSLPPVDGPERPKR